MITIIIALAGLIMSAAGFGILVYRHRNAAMTESVARDSVAHPEHPPLFFEEIIATLKMRGILFWQANLRESILHRSEKILAWCEAAFKRLAAFLRLMRGHIRRHQLNGANPEDRYWHNLNTWNARRLKLRLGRKKQREEHTESELPV